MKKWLYAVVFCLAGVLPSAAQYHNANAVPHNTGDLSFVETLANNVSRFFGLNRPEWVRQLRSEELHLSGSGPMGSMRIVTTLDFPQKTVVNHKAIYKQRMAVVQALLKKNEVLGAYKFVVPFPDDLTESMGEEDMDLLVGFLRQPIDIETADPRYLPHSVEKMQNGVIGVRLYRFGIGPFLLRIDALRKKVFLFYGEH